MKTGRPQAAFSCPSSESSSAESSSAAVASFVAGRTRPRAECYGWPRDGSDLPEVPEGRFDVVSCFFRLEDLAQSDRSALLEAMVRWVRPGGFVLIGVVNRNSYHDFTEKLRSRGSGPKGVEYVLSPDPNIGPFQSLTVPDVLSPLEASGLRLEDRLGVQAVPSLEEIEFRARNFTPRKRGLARFLGRSLGFLEKLPGMARQRGRFQFLKLRRPE